MNALEEEFANCGADYDPKVVRREVTLVTEYLPYRPTLSIYDPYYLKSSMAKTLVRDVERYLEKWVV
jgi:hypothetical protein